MEQTLMAAAELADETGADFTKAFEIVQSETESGQPIARHVSDRAERRDTNRKEWWARYRTPVVDDAVPVALTRVGGNPYVRGSTGRVVAIPLATDGNDVLRKRAATMRRVLYNDLPAPRQPSSGRYMWNRTHIDECERSGHLAAADAKALRVRMGFEFEDDGLM